MNIHWIYHVSLMLTSSDETKCKPIMLHTLLRNVRPHGLITQASRDLIHTSKPTHGVAQKRMILMHRKLIREAFCKGSRCSSQVCSYSQCHLRKVVLITLRTEKLRCQGTSTTFASWVVQHKKRRSFMNHDSFWSPELCNLKSCE